MKLSNDALTHLAKMVCGDAPHFIYRSSSKLTEFFKNLGHDFAHDGTTRRYWVRDRLEDLNNRPEKATHLPSQEIVDVINILADPRQYLFSTELGQETAIRDLNSLLALEGLAVRITNNQQQTDVIEFTDHELLSTTEPSSEDDELTIRPKVFSIPEEPVDERLVSVMMPFAAEFNATFDAIESAVGELELRVKRADQIWQNSTFIQDIFELLLRSRVVIADLSSRNPNVMYELGIAHTLGKDVIPIATSKADVPSDIIHHRALVYLPNREGYKTLAQDLKSRLRAIVHGVSTI